MQETTDNRSFTQLAAHIGIVAGTGVVLLATAILAIRVLPTAAMPPWTYTVLYPIGGLVSVAGMLIAARAVPRHRGDPALQAAGDTRLQPSTIQGVAFEPGASAGASRLERFQVETRAGRRVVAAADVEWFEAEGNYARLHVRGESLLYRMPLSQLEQALETGHFVRVHRSAIVNVQSVTAIEPRPAGDADLLLTSGARVRMSRRYARAFHDVTGRSF